MDAFSSASLSLQADLVPRDLRPYSGGCAGILAACNYQLLHTMNGGGNSGNRPQQKSNGILFGHDQRRGNVLGAGSNHTGAIVGGVVGGFFGLLLLAWLIGSTVWSWRSYSFRAHKRLLEDQVYSIVVGMRSDDIFAAGSAEETPNEKVGGSCMTMSA